MSTIRRQIAVAALTLSASVTSVAHAQPSRFEAPADLFYLHPLVNYSLPLRWEAEFERERLARGGLQVTIGSISTKDFATLARVEVSQPASERVRFAYRFDWTDSPHLDGPERQNWLGLEVAAVRTRYGVVGGEIVVHPTSDKGEMDLVTSLVWASADRRDYLRLGWRRDDFVWGDKNDLGATQTDEAAGPSWVAHLERGIWSVSSEGTVLAPYERRYPDPVRSPDLAFLRQQRSWSTHSVRARLDRHLLEVRFEHRDFERQARVPDGATLFEDEAQDSRWRHVRLAWEHRPAEHWRVRAQLHRMTYANDFLAVSHERNEILGGAFVERALGGGHWIDVGWMTTDYEWTSMPTSSAYGPDRDGTASKIALGWTLAFEGRGRLRALLSHEPDPQQFGGANVQAQILF